MRVDILRPLADGCGATGAPYIHPFQTDAIQKYTYRCCKKVHAQTMQAPAEECCVFLVHTPQKCIKTNLMTRALRAFVKYLVSLLGGKCGNVVATGIESMHVFAPRVCLWISPHYAAAKGCELLRGGASGLRVEHKGAKNQVAAAAAMWVSFDASLLLYNNTSV